MTPADDSWDSAAEHLAAIALDLHSQHTVVGTLNAICHLAVDFVDGAEEAGISVVRGKGFQTLAPTGELASEVDRIQYETSEGPCVDAIREHDTFVTGDLRQESRWPMFATRAAEQTGVVSMASFRLFIDGDTLGALNMYSRRPDSFSAVDVRAGGVLATHAAVAYDDAKVHVKAENLEIALMTSRRIGMAMGVLIALRKVTDDQAFALLQSASQRSHRKLRDLAEDVIATGTVST